MTSLAFKANIDRLPDNILLEILEYLSVKDLCISGRVCRRWRRIARDNSLWHHVDLLPYRLDLQRMWKVIRSHLSECLLTMKIRGFVDTGGPKWKKHSISNAMLEDIKDRCPNIKELHLHGVNIDNLNASLLPETLTTLAVVSSTWQPRWLKEANLPNLIHVHLNNSARVDIFDMEDIIKWTDLKKLSLGKCYRINDTGLQKIAQTLKHLHELDVGGTMCTDLTLHHISRHMTCLRHLVLTGCNKITDSGLTTLLLGLKSLEYLDVSDCKQITQNGLLQCDKSKSLRKLVCSNDVQLSNCQVNFSSPGQRQGELTV